MPWVPLKLGHEPYWRTNTPPPAALAPSALNLANDAAMQALGNYRRGKMRFPELESKPEPQLAHDSSTDTLITYYRRLKQTA
jgi:hypothetical protein